VRGRHARPWSWLLAIVGPVAALALNVVPAEAQSLDEVLLTILSANGPELTGDRGPRLGALCASNGGTTLTGAGAGTGGGTVSSQTHVVGSEEERRLIPGIAGGPDGAAQEPVSSFTWADEFLAGAHAGYDFHVGALAVGALAVGPRLGVDYRDRTIAGFGEHGATGVELFYDRCWAAAISEATP
jgi:hypothetical protein